MTRISNTLSLKGRVLGRLVFILGRCADILVKNVPAMPVVAFEENEHQHRENEPEKNTYAMPMVIEYVDTLASAAMQADSDADDEAELRESREARLAREARSLDHMMLHHKKNPACEHCQRGRMLKRYFHRVRNDPEESELPYVRPTKFGDVIEADHVFPSIESQGLSGEQAALLVRDRFSGVSLVYPQTERTVDSNYQALKHFGGYNLSGNTGVVFHSDTAQELTKAADMMCWVPDPSGPNAWPHNSHVEREVRTVKELCRPSHIQGGFHRRLWPVSLDFVAKARSFFTAAPIAAYERGTPVEANKSGKTRWEVATGSTFSGPRYPLGALVFYRSRGDGMASPTTKPGLFIGWHLSPGLRYRGNLMVIDYDAIRGRNHLYWVPRILHEKEVFLPPMLHIEFPLARAAKNALLNMDDEDHELRKKEYDRSITEGVLPYDVNIDAYPVEDTPTPERHAYITWARLLQHGFTEGCPGCTHGHHRHSRACRARFDALFPRRRSGEGQEVEPEGESGQLAVEDADDCSYAPTTPSVSGETEVPECPPDSDDEGLEELAGDSVPGMVTRQLPRTEVLSRQDALDAIRKEFDGISQMGTWDLNSVAEEEVIRAKAIEEGETIHLADLLAICSEKHVELEPKYRSLKGRVCYRGDAARTAKGEVALYQTLSASPASIVAANAIIAFGLLQGHTISTADAVKAYLQSWLQSHAATWVRLPKEVWPAEWFGADGRPKYRRPVIRLWRSLYGHPEAGSHWERHLEKELLAMSATMISEFPSTYIFDNYGGLALIVYVDDFVLAGDSEWHSRFWEDLSKRVIIDEVGDIGRFLGRHHATVKCEGQERFAFVMRSYAKDMIQEYVQLTGMPNFKKAHTPFLSKVAEKLEEEPIGRLSSLASSILMKLMWISRLARPDLLRATTWLATKIHAWTASCDGHIHRVMSYLRQTQDSLLTGWIRDPKETLYLEMFVDADFCGDEDHCFSTSGGWIQISGPDSQFPLAWISKKQGAIARSTTEAETAAMAYVLFEEGLPLLELMKRLLSPNVKLRVREDNEATAKVVTAGYSKRLRHMKRTHKINIASIAAELSKDDLELMLVNTLHQKGDLFTKAVAGPLWSNAMKLIALIEEYEIIKTSSAGLKMTGTEDISLEQAIGPEQDAVAVPRAQAFKKRKKRKPQRVPQFLQADD